MNFVSRIVLVLLIPVLASCDMKYSNDPSEVLYGEISSFNSKEKLNKILDVLSEHGFNVVPYGPGVDYHQIDQIQSFHSSEPDHQLILQVLPKQDQLIITLFPTRFGVGEKFSEVEYRFNLLSAELKEAGLIH